MSSTVLGPGRPPEIEEPSAVTIVIPRDQKDRLKAIASDTGMSMSALMRVVVDDFLGRCDGGKIKFV